MMATDWSSTEHIFFQLHTRGSSPYLKRSLLRWDSWVASIALVDSNATSSKPFVVFISKSFTYVSLPLYYLLLLHFSGILFILNDSLSVVIDTKAFWLFALLKSVDESIFLIELDGKHQ